MYELYGARQSGSVAVEAVLAEVDEAFEYVEIDTGEGEQFSPEYTRINPRQQVPALVLPDGTVLTECIAILMHVADTHPDARLAPACGSVERARLNQWLSFFATNVYEGESRRVRAVRYSTDPSAAAGISEAATKHIARHYEIFEGSLRTGPYYGGDRPTLLDLYVWMLVQWWGDDTWLRSNCPRIHRLVETVRQRRAVAPIHARHFEPGSD